MAYRWIRFRLCEEVYRQALAAAESDRRSVANWLTVIVERALAEEEKVT